MSLVRFKFRFNILISGKIIKEMPGSVASGTLCTILTVGRFASSVPIYVTVVEYMLRFEIIIHFYQVT